ncbi:TPA: hypothetical protein DEP21_01190 [Patescibacteria group bacterium]|nr:hypothetical protein [Candidatus Gracilibacteria bacterium]
MLLSVKEYAIPLISGTATTLVVFLPMLTLPGLMGKFLAYIPITIFITLLGSLFIALTINSALYLKLSSPKKHYEDIGEIEYLPKDELELLYHERQGKTPYHQEKISRRERMLDKMTNWYSVKLSWLMENARMRALSFIVPLIVLILSFVFLSPQIGFNLFPSSDSPWLFATISAKKGTTKEFVAQQVVGVD